MQEEPLFSYRLLLRLGIQIRALAGGFRRSGERFMGEGCDRTEDEGREVKNARGEDISAARRGAGSGLTREGC